MQTRIWIGWVALTALGILGACSDGATSSGENPGGSAGSTAAGSAGKASGGTNSSGAGGSASTAGKGGTAGSGGSTAGNGGSVAGSGGTSAGAAGSGGLGGAQGGMGAGGEDVGQGGQDVGQGGEGGIVDTNCEIEALHFKVSGGASFERTWPSNDYCGGVTGGDDDPLIVSFFLNPPELENTVLATSMAYSIAPGTTGTFTPQSVSVISTAAIWSTDYPDPQHPIACSMNVTKYEKVDDVHWRVAGSVSCPSALGNFGENAKSPLTIEDWTYSVVIDMTME